MTCLLAGPGKWSMTRDDKGCRTYKLASLVITDDKADGPGTVMMTPGLPLVGSYWVLGNDIDLWCWCRWEMSVTSIVTDEPTYHWLVENTFSNKPNDRPNDNPNDNPLLELPKISGDYIKILEEASHDRFGRPLLSSSHEPIRGQQVEFDVTRGTIRIEQNFPYLDFALNEITMNSVNDRPLWGLPKRCIKLSGIKWERLFHGLNEKYYKRSLDFETNRTTFDRLAIDQGSRVLHGRWTNTGAWELVNIDGEPPDPTNPSHFMEAVDRKNNPTKLLLNGRGVPAKASITNATDLKYIGTYYISVQAGNLNQSLLANTEWWIEWLDTFSSWDPNATYEPGSVLFIQNNQTGIGGDDETLRCFINVITSTPGIPPPSFKWVEILSGDGLTAYGDWDATATYPIGAWVTYPLAKPEAIGQIPLSKYSEANFLLLDVPLFF